MEILELLYMYLLLCFGFVYISFVLFLGLRLIVQAVRERIEYVKQRNKLIEKQRSNYESKM